MAISSNAFFHFTSKVDVLENILKEGFWPRYCIEKGWGHYEFDFALPMVCLCDIPLTQIHNHTKIYGGFGIGLTYEWVKTNKLLNPVYYISRYSELYNKVSRELTNLKNGDKTLDVNFLCRVKKVRGKQKIFDGLEPKELTIKYYDEREWRYVPKINETYGLIPSRRNNPINVDEKSKLTENLKLEFSPEDIRYIIIPNEKYRKRIINFLRQTFKHSKENIDILISRIESLEQIKKDF